MFDFGISDVHFGIYPNECRVDFGPKLRQWMSCSWNRHAGIMQGDWERRYLCDERDAA